MEVIQSQLDESQKDLLQHARAAHLAQQQLQQQQQNQQRGIRPTSTLMRQSNPSSLVAPQPS